MTKITTARIHLKAITAGITGILTLLCLICFTAYAASVSFNVRVPSESVSPGDTVTITVGVVADSEPVASYSYNIIYDPTLLQPVDTSSEAYEGCITYSGTGDGTTDSQEMTFSFTALECGTASIETAAVSITLQSGDAVNAATTYNSISISDKPSAGQNTDSSTTENTDTSDSTLSQNIYDEPSTASGNSEQDEVGTLTESAQDEADVTPTGTLVTMHAGGSTYYVLSKPGSVDVPDYYLPVTISLNDVDVKAYMRNSDGNTVLLYAENSDGHQGWYFFNVSDGNFFDAEDIINGTGTALDNFMDKYKFVIMLIAIIILVVLIVVIVILSLSFRNAIKEYEAEIDKLKSSAPSDSAPRHNTSSGKEPVRLTRRDNGEIPTIGDKALFPEDDSEDTHESYADSDYDNQVQFDEDEFTSPRNYSDDAFDDTDSDEDSDSTEIDSAFAVTASAEDDSDSSRNVKQSLEDIDAVLKSAKKYTK